MYTETLPLCINIYSTKVEIETLQIEFSVEYNVLKICLQLKKKREIWRDFLKTNTNSNPRGIDKFTAFHLNQKLFYRKLISSNIM